MGAYLSKEQLREMEAHEAFVRGAVERAEEKADSFFTGLLNLSDDAMDGVVRQAREMFNDWAGRRQKWVHAGVDDDGSLYTLTSWLELGNEIAALVQETTREYDAYSTANAVEYTVSESVEDVEETLQETMDVAAKPWGFSTRAALWGLGGLAGLVAVGYGLRPLVQLATMAGAGKGENT